MQSSSTSAEPQEFRNSKLSSPAEKIAASSGKGGANLSAATPSAGRLGQRFHPGPHVSMPRLTTQPPPASPLWFRLGGGKQKWKGSRTLGKSQGRQLHSEGELAMPVSTHLPVLWMQVSFIKTLFVV